MHQETIPLEGIEFIESKDPTQGTGTIVCGSRKAALVLYDAVQLLLNKFNERRTMAASISFRHLCGGGPETLVRALSALEASLGGDILLFMDKAVAEISKYACIVNSNSFWGRVELTPEGAMKKQEYPAGCTVVFTATAENGVCQEFKMEFVKND